MNRAEILKLLGYTYKPEYMDVQEVLSIPPQSVLAEDRLAIKVFNKLHKIEVEIKYLTEEKSDRIWACTVNLENDLFSSAYVEKQNSKISLTEAEFKDKVLSIFTKACDNDSTDSLTFAI